jgi:hypothetical protein
MGPPSPPRLDGRQQFEGPDPLAVPTRPTARLPTLPAFKLAARTEEEPMDHQTQSQAEPHFRNYEEAGWYPALDPKWSAEGIAACVKDD